METIPSCDNERVEALSTCHMPDEIPTLSQASGPTDEPKISSGLSQSHMGDEPFEIVQ